MDDKIRELIEAWCDRRCYKSLRYILNAWPLGSGLTDDFANLLQALKSIRATARSELSSSETLQVDDLVREVEKLVHR